MDGNFKLDMHVHTSETSVCGEVQGAEVVRRYHSLGYQGIMITDHYHKEYFDGLGALDTYQKIEVYLAGYRAAKQEGDRVGLNVLLGIEFRNFESENDFLIVGITETFLHDYPETYMLPLEEAVDLFHQHGMAVIQAHPYRFRMIDKREGKLFRSYKNYEMLEMIQQNPDIREVFIGCANGEKAGGEMEYPYMLRVCDLQCEDKLDGIEVYNGNYHWAQKPELIQAALARHPEYIQISASDFHEMGHAGRGGIVLKKAVKDSQELKEALLNRDIVGWIKN